MGRITVAGTDFEKLRVYARPALLGWLVAGACMLGPLGCGPPIGTLVDANGNSIRQSAITRIVDDDELTDSEKRDALQALGIRDIALIELLLQ